MRLEISATKVGRLIRERFCAFRIPNPQNQLTDRSSMPPQEKVQIVGIGDDGLEGVTSAARTLIEQADLLVGADHTLRLVPSGKAERLVAGGNLDAIVERIAGAGGRRVVVLVSGDPLFYGLARYLCEKLGKDRFVVVPHVSSMQLAFAAREGKLGRSIPHQSGESPTGAGDRTDSRGRERRSFHERGLPAVESCAGAVGSADRLFLGLRVREPGFARRARDAWQFEGAGCAGFRPVERDDPGAQTRRARSRVGRDRAALVR